MQKDSQRTVCFHIILHYFLCCKDQPSKFPSYHLMVKDTQINIVRKVIKPWEMIFFVCSIVWYGILCFLCEKDIYISECKSAVLLGEQNILLWIYYLYFLWVQLEVCCVNIFFDVGNFCYKVMLVTCTQVSRWFPLIALPNGLSAWAITAPLMELSSNYRRYVNICNTLSMQTATVFKFPMYSGW